MIDISINADGEFRVGQRMASPAVYLEYWALLDFSEDENLADQLRTALKLRKGTLVLSWLNLAEHSRMTNEGQARKAERLVEENLPRLFFIEIEPFRVIRGEDSILSGGARVPPHGDNSLLRELVYLKSDSPASVNPFTTHNLFKYTQDPDLDQRFDVLADTVIECIEAMQNDGFMICFLVSILLGQPFLHSLGALQELT